MFSTKDDSPNRDFTGGDIHVMLPNVVLKTVLNHLPLSKCSVANLVRCTVGLVYCHLKTRLYIS